MQSRAGGGVAIVGPRRRGAALGLAILAACGVSACGEEEPVSIAYGAYRAPTAVDSGFVEYPTPAESLLVYEPAALREASAGDLRLLFHRGRGIARDATGAAYLPDLAGSRILVVEPGLRVVRAIGGPDPENGPVGFPLSVAPAPDGSAYLTDVEHPDGLLYYDPAGAYVGSATPPVLNPVVRAAADGSLWAARSPYVQGFDPATPSDPLLYRFDPFTGEGVGIAAIEPVGQPAWNRLANAGPVAVGADGVAYFAFLLRNELRAYRPDGTLAWRVRRSLPIDEIPGVVEDTGDGFARLQPVTQALAMGPDEKLYALTASGDRFATGSSTDHGQAGEADETRRRRLEVYDPSTGELLRATTIPESWTSFAADAKGHVVRVDPDSIEAGAPPPERAPLPDVPLVGFDGDTARFGDHRGKALLVNFWASWCVPCRAELPQLKSHYLGLSPEDRDYVEFLAISDDADPDAAREFAAPLELPFPLFLGGGDMQAAFRYIGLPYTLVVDYRGRIVEEFYGFGSPVSWDRLTGVLQTEIERARPSTRGEAPGAHEGHAGHGSGP